MYSPWAQQESHIHITLKQYKIDGWHNGKRAKHRQSTYLQHQVSGSDLRYGTDESMLKTKFKTLSPTGIRESCLKRAPDVGG
jgi:hypothetical protein